MFKFQQETSSGSTDPSSSVLVERHRFDENVASTQFLQVHKRADLENIDFETCIYLKAI